MRPGAFADACFVAIGDSHRFECDFIVLGEVIDRACTIQRYGYLGGRRCAKIHRVRRIDLSAECHDAIPASGRALWLQMSLIEQITGKYDMSSFSPPTEYPMRNPFTPTPEDIARTRELNLAAPKLINTARYPRHRNRLDRQRTNGRKHIVLHVRKNMRLLRLRLAMANNYYTAINALSYSSIKRRTSMDCSGRCFLRIAVRGSPLYYEFSQDLTIDFRIYY